MLKAFKVFRNNFLLTFILENSENSYILIRSVNRRAFAANTLAFDVLPITFAFAYCSLSHNKRMS